MVSFSSSIFEQGLARTQEFLGAETLSVDEAEGEEDHGEEEEFYRNEEYDEGENSSEEIAECEREYDVEDEEGEDGKGYEDVLDPELVNGQPIFVQRSGTDLQIGGENGRHHLRNMKNAAQERLQSLFSGFSFCTNEPEE